jgi:hypothetical protein
MNDEYSYSATDDVEEMYLDSDDDDNRPKKVLIRTTTKAENAAAAAAASSNGNEDEVPSFVGEPVAKDFDGDTFFGSITSICTGDDFNKLWHVVYNDDDDREDWNLNEVIVGTALYRKMTETEFPTPKNKKPSRNNPKNNKTRSNEKKMKAKLKRAGASNGNDSVFSHGNYLPAEPYVYEVEYHDQDENDFEEYMPIPLPQELRHDPKFSLPHGVNPLIDTISHLALPDSLIEKIVKYSNVDARSQLPDDKYKQIKKGEFLIFFAIYYYMGYCKMPARQDYWKETDPDSIVPQHWIRGKMGRNRFDYIWRNIHLGPSGIHDAVDEEVLDVDDGQFQTDSVNRGEDDSYDKEDEEEDEEDDDDDDDDEEEEEKEDGMNIETDDEYNTGDNIDLWYSKAKLILDHVNQFSTKLWDYPGFALSLDDEMMKLSKGRSSITVHMKKKPIKGG